MFEDLGERGWGEGRGVYNAEGRDFNKGVMEMTGAKICLSVAIVREMSGQRGDIRSCQTMGSQFHQIGKPFASLKTKLSCKKEIIALKMRCICTTMRLKLAASCKMLQLYRFSVTSRS